MNLVFLAGLSRSGKSFLRKKLGALSQWRFEKVSRDQLRDLGDSRKNVVYEDEAGGISDHRRRALAQLPDGVATVFVLLEITYDIYEQRYRAASDSGRRMMREEFERKSNKANMPTASEGFARCIRCRIGLPALAEGDSEEVQLIECQTEHAYRTWGIQRLLREIVTAFNPPEPDQGAPRGLP